MLKDFNLDEVLPKDHRFKYCGRFITFDQSLNHTGWAVLDTTVSYDILKSTATYKRLVATGTLHGNVVLSDRPAIMKRVVELNSEVMDLLGEYSDIVHVICELPPMANRLIKPESSLLACAAIATIVGQTPNKLHLVSSQQAKSLWVGYGNAKKDLVKKALLEWWPELNDWKPKLNEHQIDAIANGLTWAKLVEKW